MTSSFRVNPADLLAAAAEVDQVRAAIHPGSVPVAFPPCGADTASCASATAVSARAAVELNGLWKTWAELGKLADALRGNARAYDSKEQDNTALLSGGSGGSGTYRTADVPQVPTVVTPQVFTGSGGSPEQVSALLHDGGSGTQGPQAFGQQWEQHGAALHAASSSVNSLRARMAGFWDGPAHDNASETMGSLGRDLARRGGRFSEVGGAAHTSAMDWKTATGDEGGVPHPSKFEAGHQKYNQAVAANNAYPGVYAGDVAAAQQEIANLYLQTSEAYGKYAIDPLTGEPIALDGGSQEDGETLDAAGDLTKDPSMMSTGTQLLSSLLGPIMGGVGGAVGAVTQGAQQVGQMASQGLQQVSKAVEKGSESADLDLPDLGAADGSFGGGGGGDAGGGGGTSPAGVLGAPVAAAGAAQSPPRFGSALTTSVGPGSVREGFSGMGAPMGPMGPMGGAAGAGAGQTKTGASGDGKKLVPEQRANTQKVIGEASADRLRARRTGAREKMEALRTGEDGKDAKASADKDEVST